MVALYSTESLPFEAPTTGTFAIKVINHYGDAVLKVYTGSERLDSSARYNGRSSRIGGLMLAPAHRQAA